MVYRVGTETFRRKSDVTARADMIRLRTPLGQPITGPDREFILALLQHHPEASEKLRGGVESVSTMNNIFGTVSFCITRSDGSPDDFSVSSCVRQLTKHAP